MFITGPFLFDKNKELWTELGPAVTAKIGYEGNSRSVRRVLPKITSLHEVTAARTPSLVGFDHCFDTFLFFKETEDSSGVNSSNIPPLLVRASLELQHELLAFFVLVIFVVEKN